MAKNRVLWACVSSVDDDGLYYVESLFLCGAQRSGVRRGAGAEAADAEDGRC
jgi:hypothetical protein